MPPSLIWIELSVEQPPADINKARINSHFLLRLWLRRKVKVSLNYRYYGSVLLCLASYRRFCFNIRTVRKHAAELRDCFIFIDY